MCTRSKKNIYIYCISSLQIRTIKHTNHMLRSVWTERTQNTEHFASFVFIPHFLFCAPVRSHSHRVDSTRDVGTRNQQKKEEEQICIRQFVCSAGAATSRAGEYGLCWAGQMEMVYALSLSLSLRRAFFLFSVNIFLCVVRLIRI